MRIWVYGDSPEWIRDMIKENISFDDTVTDTSISAEIGSSFPQSGLTPAISAAIRGEIDLLLILSLKTACLRSRIRTVSRSIW